MTPRGAVMVWGATGAGAVGGVTLSGLVLHLIRWLSGAEWDAALTACLMFIAACAGAGGGGLWCCDYLAARRRR